MSYAVFFNYENTTYRLPANPAEIRISSVQANEKYNILKLGEVVVPTHEELKTYSFECEFPQDKTHYTQTNNEFKNADFYLKLFSKVREDKKTIRFIASNGIAEDINSLVLIEELEIVEKAGEEGDKYITFSLVEYKEFSKKVKEVQKVQIASTTVLTVKEQPKEEKNPKSTGSYVVQSGDTLFGIAKKHYGNGNQYPKILNANKDKIKNANLIYPNMLLKIP